jgi:WD40 repeat protein
MLMRDTNLLFVGALFDIILISFTTQRVCSTVRAHKSYITCLKELDIKKKLFASGSVDKSVKIWSLVESSCQLILLRTLDAHSTRIDQIMRMDR